MEQSKKDKLITFIIAVLGVLTVIVGVNLNTFFSSKPKIKPAEYTVYSTIKGKNPDKNMKRLIIAQDHKNDKPAGLDADGITKRFRVKGRLSLAYLYIEALVDYSRPLTEYDDIYFSINDVGGHLVPDGNALPVPPAEFSRYLYDLRSVVYYKSIKEKRVDIPSDLFKLLHDGANIKIEAFISSNRPGSIMKELSIYYKCKGTPKDCSIE